MRVGSLGIMSRFVDPVLSVTFVGAVDYPPTAHSTLIQVGLGIYDPFLIPYIPYLTYYN
jgi:hypothetical protein